LLQLLLSCKSASTEHIKKETEPKDYPELNYSVPTGGNSWCVNEPDLTKKMIIKEGITGWSGEKTKIRTYFKVNSTGELNVGLRAKVKTGMSRIKCSYNGKSHELELSNRSFRYLGVGTFEIKDPGYHFVDFEGISKDGTEYADISDLLLGGAATIEGLVYIKNENYYWARRNPAISLNYVVPDEVSNALYFYNEITVPEGEDVIGSYFMSSGFKGGYLGLQVNDEHRRQFLFSIWSDYKTNDPSQIPKDYDVVELKHGKDVDVGKFGGEGAGAQSKRVFNWNTGTTYKFLVKAEPAGNNSTDYTGWIFIPEFGDWQLMASFRKPKVSLYLENVHSFMENFHGKRGDLSRKGMWSNQWFYDATTKKWYESLSARFGASGLTQRGERADYAAAANRNGYFMSICGFFNDGPGIGIEKGAMLERSPGTPPDIDLSTLP
jgi:hypothetical protein